MIRMERVITLSEAAKVFAAAGGRAKSERKTRASRRNGKKGGRPKQVKSEQSTKKS